MNIALIFQGQGSQYVGMGKSIYENFKEGKEIFDLAGEKIKNLCFNSSLEELSITKNTQPAVFTMTYATYMAFSKKLDLLPISKKVLAGFSLGEFSALCASNVLSFSDSLNLVKFRAKWMNEFDGKMCASIGKWEKTINAIKKASEFGICEAVNFNSPNQIVVAGDNLGIENFINFAQEEGLRAIPLMVSGPFHSSILKPVGLKLEFYLSNLTLNSPIYPTYSNVTAKPHKYETLKELIAKQVYSPVLWVDIINNIVNEEGIDIFIEIGPGKTLGSFIKKIDKNVKVYTVQDEASLNETINSLTGLIS